MRQPLCRNSVGSTQGPESNTRVRVCEETGWEVHQNVCPGEPKGAREDCIMTCAREDCVRSTPRRQSRRIARKWKERIIRTVRRERDHSYRAKEKGSFPQCKGNRIIASVQRRKDMSFHKDFAKENESFLLCTGHRILPTMRRV